MRRHQLQQLLMQNPTARQHVGPVDRVAPIDRRRPSTRPLDHRHQRTDVPGLERRVEHRVGAAGGHLEVAVAIAPGAVEQGAARDGFEGGAVGALHYFPVTGRQHGGFFELRRGAHAHWPVAEQRGAAALAHQHMAIERVRDGAEDGSAVAQQRAEDDAVGGG